MDLWYDMDSAAVDDINRITVEFKCGNGNLIFRMVPDINRITVEFKCERDVYKELYNQILIESQWNLNKGIQDAIKIEVDINRITVEFKFIRI